MEQKLTSTNITDIDLLVLINLAVVTGQVALNKLTLFFFFVHTLEIKLRGLLGRSGFHFHGTHLSYIGFLIREMQGIICKYKRQTEHVVYRILSIATKCAAYWWVEKALAFKHARKGCRRSG